MKVATSSGCQSASLRRAGVLLGVHSKCSSGVPGAVASAARDLLPTNVTAVAAAVDGVSWCLSRLPEHPHPFPSQQSSPVPPIQPLQLVLFL